MGTVLGAADDGDGNWAQKCDSPDIYRRNRASEYTGKLHHVLAGLLCLFTRPEASTNIFQISTAFGVFLGSLMGVALQNVGHAGDSDSCPLDKPARLLSQACSLSWRLMLVSPMLPAIFILLYVYECHESSRWLVAKAHRLRDNRLPNTAKVHYQQAYKALEDISRHRFLAARDILYQYYSLLHEAKESADRQDEHPKSSWLTHKLSKLFGSHSRQENKRENRQPNRRRNRRAIIASSLCMFAQQFR